VGDDLTVYFIGEKVRVRKFHITEVHRDLLELDDNLLVYAGIEDMQRLNGWSSEEVSCLDILTGEADPDPLTFAVGTLAEDSISLSYVLEEEEPVEKINSESEFYVLPTGMVYNITGKSFAAA
ncbi:MAG: hypothetical protein II517_03485, partial [Ruminococcus sp.]|nr:hypothetical protein [Ruminococcus sp.]